VQRDYSIYEDYTTTSSNYDSTRVAVGTDLILAGLAAARGGAVPVSEMALLDGGCGTGNYIEALRRDVSTVHGLEFNDGMFAQVPPLPPSCRQCRTIGPRTRARLTHRGAAPSRRRQKSSRISRACR
jgi:hypothetical protein